MSEEEILSLFRQGTRINSIAKTYKSNYDAITKNKKIDIKTARGIIETVITEKFWIPLRKGNI